MAKATFRNKDQRLIKKAGKVIQSILLRDQIAVQVKAGTKRTTILSTTNLIFDNDPSPSGLLGQANAILEALLTDLYQPGTVPGGVTPLKVFGSNPIKIVRS